jgi:hypothetical protein
MKKMNRRGAENAEKNIKKNSKLNNETRKEARRSFYGVEEDKSRRLNSYEKSNAISPRSNEEHEGFQLKTLSFSS